MKSIPSSVTVGGIKFRIVVAAIDGGDYGRMVFDERKILISTICLTKQSLIRETLRHEILHAALHVSGVSFLERYDEEPIVRAIEHVFFHVGKKSAKNYHENHKQTTPKYQRSPCGVDSRIMAERLYQQRGQSNRAKQLSKMALGMLDRHARLGG